MADDPTQTTKPMKIAASFAMLGATLTVNRSGHDNDDGAGVFRFDEDDVVWLPHDEQEGHYLEAYLARSEMIELRDFLLREFPLGATP